jgi:hypothetical protein
MTKYKKCFDEVYAVIDAVYRCGNVVKEVRFVDRAETTS